MGGVGGVGITLSGGMLSNTGVVMGGVGGAAGGNQSGDYPVKGRGGAGGIAIILSGGSLSNFGEIDGGVGGNSGYLAYGSGAGGIGLEVTVGSASNAGSIAGGDGGTEQGAEGSGAGGAGGAGGLGVALSSGSFSNTGTISGGDGGTAGYEANIDYDGGAGAGAAGIAISGGSLTNTGAILGGVGGAGYNSLQPGGPAGVGGVGIILSGGSFTSAGTIKGGDGGTGGSGGAAGDGGTGGDGGAGIELFNGSFTNTGTIVAGGGGAGGVGGAAGSAGDGVIASGVGQISNGAAGSGTALISGVNGIVVTGPGAFTVTNFGTIAGAGDSVLFVSTGDRLIAESGAVFSGQVVGGGGTLELGAGEGTISGLGVDGALSGAVTASFSGFGAYSIDTGGRWTISGGGELGSTQTMTIANGGQVTLASGTLSNAGTIGGADGAITLAGGSIFNVGLIAGGTGNGVSVSGSGQFTNGEATFLTGSINVATGLNSAGALQTAGDLPDANWTVTHSNSYLNAPIAYTVFPGDADFYENWVPNGAYSDWIAGDPNNTDNGNLTLTRTFVLTASQAASANFSGAWAIDDFGSVYLNGHLLDTEGKYNFKSLHDISAPSADFVAGVNTLVMQGVDSDDYLEGGRLQGTVTYDGSPSSQATVSGFNGVDATGVGDFTVTNFGTITGANDSVLFGSGNDRLIAEAGSVFDGQIVGGGGTLELAGGAGAITGLGASGALSGAVTASFSGFGAYELDSGGAWTITNSGSLSAHQSLTVATGAALTVTASSAITNSGAFMLGGALSNTGTIVGEGVDGLTLVGAGQIINGTVGSTGALLSGLNGVVATGAGGATVTNFGTISGADAVFFNSATDTLIEEGSGVLTGKVLGGGGTLELAAAAGTGTISGLGSTITGFSTIDVDVGAGWHLAGVNKLLAGETLQTASAIAVANAGELVNEGVIDLGALVQIGQGGLLDNLGQILIGVDVSLSQAAGTTGARLVSAGLLEKSGGTGVSKIAVGLTDTGTITIDSGTVDIAGAVNTLSGTVNGTGLLEFDGGDTTAKAGAALDDATEILGTGTTLTLATSLTLDHGFDASGANSLVIDTGDTFTLSHVATFTGSTVDGGGHLVTSATTKVSGETLGGKAEWLNGGGLTDAGVLTIGDGVTADKALFVNEAGGVFDLSGAAADIATGVSASNELENAGLLERTGAIGISTIAPRLVNAGTIEAATGTIDITGIVSGTGLSEIRAGATLEFAAAVGAGGLVDLDGSKAVLLLADAAGFKSQIEGFTSGRTIDLRGGGFTPGATLSYSGSSTSGTLTVRDGTSVARIALLGQYAAANFKTASDGSGGLDITFVASPAPALATPAQG
jgi:hypothetical protein